MTDSRTAPNHPNPYSDFDADDLAVVPHSRARKVVAVLLAAMFFGISVLAASYSLFKGHPAPEVTRPLPRPLPHQGGITAR